MKMRIQCTRVLAVAGLCGGALWYTYTRGSLNRLSAILRQTLRPLVALLIACGSLAPPLAFASAPTTPAEAYKLLLSNSPQVRQITWAEMKIGDTNSSVFYTGAVDGTNFFLRRYIPGENLNALLSPTNPMQFPYFVGACGPKHWQIDGLTVHETEETASPIFIGAKTARQILERGLAFGLLSEKVGSFVWDGDRYSAAPCGPMPGSESYVFHGTLTTSNSYPVRVDCGGQTVYYDYSDRTLPPGVPSAIMLCKRDQPKQAATQAMLILRYKSGSSADETFEPYRHLDSRYMGIRRIVGGRELLVKDNTLAMSRAHMKAAPKGKRVAVLAVLGVISLISVVLLFRAMVSRRKP